MAKQFVMVVSWGESRGDEILADYKVSWSKYGRLFFFLHYSFILTIIILFSIWVATALKSIQKCELSQIHIKNTKVNTATTLNNNNNNNKNNNKDYNNVRFVNQFLHPVFSHISALLACGSFAPSGKSPAFLKQQPCGFNFSQYCVFVTKKKYANKSKHKK